MRTVFMVPFYIQNLSFCRSLTSNCLKDYTNDFDDEKYSKQYCEIYNVII